ncbi:PQQ-binding-like beta-propeller repeat protein [Phosphitispora sp. TUW77]|uniref:outer membrane protein assembly factor BamB family protein n=1 Tax=Phosphitispora sp. TUW77 TaxID=3152361 RepID=UPI003AB349BD
MVVHKHRILYFSYRPVRVNRENKPVADHERVYVVDDTYKLYAFDKNSGKLAWTAPIDNGVCRVECGADEPPQLVAVGNMVFAVSGGGVEEKEGIVFAFEAETGKLLSRTVVPPKEERYIRGYRLPEL